MSTILDYPCVCLMAVLRTLQMCELTDDNVLQMPSECPWCYKTLSVKEHSFFSQIGIHMDHLSTVAACVHSYTGILADNNEIKGQVLPTTTQLLSEEDRKRMTRFLSPFAICYFSKNGHRQWPSMSESILAFVGGNFRVRPSRASLAGRDILDLRVGNPT